MKTIRRFFFLIIFIFAMAYVGNNLSYIESQIKIAGQKLNVLSTSGSVNLDSIQNLAKDISNSGPLVSNQTPSGKILTQSGTFNLTNKARKDNGALPALSENFKLDQIAELRMKDMFAKQYFEHTSPSGETAQKLTETVGYDYVIVGENIALGNFDGDQGLVTAWMNSPGHRANILNSRYTELGVAVGRGTYKGETTWIGVQIFGKPLSDCPTVDANLKNTIAATQAETESLKAQADALMAIINQTNSQTEPQKYNSEALQYNTLVKQINSKVADSKSSVDTYNAEVKAFNNCIK